MLGLDVGGESRVGEVAALACAANELPAFLVASGFAGLLFLGFVVFDVLWGVFVVVVVDGVHLLDGVVVGEGDPAVVVLLSNGEEFRVVLAFGDVAQVVAEQGTPVEVYR